MEWFPKSPDTLRDMNSNDIDQLLHRNGLNLDLGEERERLAELKAMRDAVSDKLMAVTLDGDDPVTYADYQIMLGRERRLDNRIWATRQAIRELKAAGAR